MEKIKNLWKGIVGKADSILEAAAKKLHTTKKQLITLIAIVVGIIVSFVPLILLANFTKIPKDAIAIVNANKISSIKDAGFSVGGGISSRAWFSAKWKVDDQNDFKFKEYPKDISQKDTMNFWYKLDSEKDARVMFYFGSENPDTKGADYYSYTVTLKPGEWKKMTINMSRLAIYGKPQGLDQLTEISIRTTGWMNSAQKGSEIRFGHIYLDGKPVKLQNYITQGNSDIPHFTKVLIDEAAEIAANPTGWPRFYLGSGLDSYVNSDGAINGAQALYYLSLAVYYNEMDEQAEPLTATNGMTAKEAAIKLLEFYLTGGNEPAATPSPSWGHTVFTSALIQIKNTEAIYSELSPETKDKMDWIMRAFAIAGNWGFNDNNNYDTGLNLKGNFNKTWNMNYQNAILGYVVTGSLYFGQDKLQDIYTDFNYDIYMEKFRQYDFINMISVWETAGKSLMEKGVMEDGSDPVIESVYAGITDGTVVGDAGGSGKGAKQKFKYTCTVNGKKQTLTLDQEDFTEKVFAYLVEETYKFDVQSSIGKKGADDYCYIYGDVIGTKTDPKTGKITYEYSELKSPLEGRTGMMSEFLSADASGIRSDAGYCYHSYMILVSIYQNMRMYGGWDSSTEYMQALDEQIYVGNEDLLFRMEHGYHGYKTGEAHSAYARDYAHHGYWFSKDIWNNVICDWGANVTNAEYKVNAVSSLEKADPLGGVVVAPNGALASYGTYADKFVAKSFTSIGKQTNGTVEFDMVIGNNVPKGGAGEYDAVVTLMSGGTGETWNNMEMSIQLTDQSVNIRSGGSYARTGFGFGLNYRFRTEVSFNVPARTYSVKINQIYPSVGEVYTCENIPFRTSGDFAGYVDKIGVITSREGSDLWLENVYVNGSLIKGTDVKYDTTVGVKPKDAVPPKTYLRVHRDEWTEFTDYTKKSEVFYVRKETVAMTCYEEASELESMSYYVSTKPLSLSAVKGIKDWTKAEYDVDCFKLKPYQKTYVYLKSKDSAGNVCYVSKCLLLDPDLPTVSGIKDGVSYCEGRTIKITDKYLSSVLLNGEEIIAKLGKDGSYKFDTNSGSQTLVITDRAGNTRRCKVIFSDKTLKDNHLIDGMDSSTISSVGWTVEEDEVYGNNLYSANQTVKEESYLLKGLSGDLSIYDTMKFAIKIKSNKNKGQQRVRLVFHAGTAEDGKWKTISKDIEVPNNKWVQYSLKLSELKVLRGADLSEVTSVRIYTGLGVYKEYANLTAGSEMYLGYFTMEARDEVRVHAQNHSFKWVLSETDSTKHDQVYSCCDSVRTSQKHTKAKNSNKCSVCRCDMGTSIQISYGLKVWDELLEKDGETDYANIKRVNINAADYGFGIKKIEYAESKTYVKPENVSSLKWKAIDNGFSVTLKEDEAKYVYARVTDKNGKVAYASTNAIVYDITEPVISGVESGATYCAPPRISVKDKNFDSLTVNGKSVKLTDNQYTFEENSGTSKVIATDKAGNSVSMYVTVKNQQTKDRVVDFPEKWTANSENYYSFVTSDETHTEPGANFSAYKYLKIRIKVTPPKGTKISTICVRLRMWSHTYQDYYVPVKGNEWQTITVDISNPDNVVSDMGVNNVRRVCILNDSGEADIPNGSTIEISDMRFVEARVHTEPKQTSYVKHPSDSKKHNVIYACCDTVIKSEEHTKGSNGKCTYCTAPTISGVINNGIYCSGPEIKVTDNTKLKSVTVNGEEVKLDKNGKYKIPNIAGYYDIKAIDEYNCVTKYGIEVYSGTVNETEVLDGSGFTQDMSVTDWKDLWNSQDLGQLLSRYTTITYTIKVQSDILAKGTDVAYHLGFRKGTSNEHQFMYRSIAKVGQTTKITMKLDDYVEVVGSIKNISEVTNIQFRAHYYSDNKLETGGCTVEVSDLTLTGLKAPKSHVFNEVVKDQWLVDASQVATCLKGSNYYKSCVCGEKSSETFEGPVDANNHAKNTYAYESLNEKQHNKSHECCGALIATEAHANSAATTMGYYECEHCGEEQYYDYLDHVAPVISYIENGKVYEDGDQKMLVQDDMLASVTVNGQNIAINTDAIPNSAEYAFEITENPYEIVATDIAGNVTRYTITVWEKVSLFEADFESSSDSSLISEGWTAHSGKTDGNAQNNQVTIHSSKALNMWSDTGWAGPRIIKHINVGELKDITVEFDMKMASGVADNGAPEFYVGTVADDNVTDRYFEPNKGGSNTSHMSQIYWSADKSMATDEWKNVRLEFAIADSNSAVVTAYVKEGDTWQQSGEPQEIALFDGVLNLAFVCKAYTTSNTWDEAYIDNVDVYSMLKDWRKKAPVISGIQEGYTYYENDEPVMTVTDKDLDEVTINGVPVDIRSGAKGYEASYKFALTGDYTIVAKDKEGNQSKSKIYIKNKSMIFESNFNSSTDGSLISDGWTAHSGKTDGQATNNNVTVHSSKALNLWSQSSWAGPRIIKHIDVDGLDNVVVDFDMQLLDGVADKDAPELYVGTVAEDNVTNRYLEPNKGGNNTSHMSQIYWTAGKTMAGEWKNVRLSFAILDSENAVVTVYLKNGDVWQQAGEAKEVELYDGVLKLAFAARTYTDADASAWDEVYIDNVSVYTGVNKWKENAPVISGIQDKVSYYKDEEVAMTVTDHDLDKVTVNGEPIVIKELPVGYEATYSFDALGTYTIVAKDKEDHEIEYRIYVKEASDIFETDFESSTNDSLISDGWTEHSDESKGGGAKQNRVRLNTIEQNGFANHSGSNGNILALYSGYGTSAPRIYKTIDTDEWKRITVEFKTYLDNPNEESTTPTLYVATLEENDMSSRYIKEGSAGNNTAGMNQIFWSVDRGEADRWIDAKLEFTIIDSDTAKVTAYIKEGTKWVADSSYTEQTVTLRKGKLDLAFACNANTTDGNYNCAYLDDVSIYAIAKSLEEQPPVISGIQDEMTYYDNEVPEMTVTDQDLDEVTINGKSIKVEVGSEKSVANYKFVLAGTYEVVAKDKEGNKSVCEIKVKKAKTIFESNFDSSTDESLISDGWTAHSGKHDKGADKNNLTIHSSKRLNLWSDYSGAGPRIYKDINVTGLDNLVVEFDVELCDGADTSELSGNNLKRAEASPAFYVGQLEDNDLTSRYVVEDPSGSNTAKLSQIYWSADKTMAGKAHNVKLEFEILDGENATVTAYVDGVPSGASKDVAITDGVLQLAFAFRAFTQDNTWDEAYLDNVSIYTGTDDCKEDAPIVLGVRDEGIYFKDEKPEMSLLDHDLDKVTVNGKSVEIKAAPVGYEVTYQFDKVGTYAIVAEDKEGNKTEYTISIVEPTILFDSNFDSSTDTSLISDGWTAHSDQSNGGKATNNLVRIADDRLRLRSNTGGTGPRIYKNINVADMKQVVVEFDAELVSNVDASALSSNNKKRAQASPALYVGELKDGDVSSRYLIDDPSGSNIAKMSQVYWSADKTMAGETIHVKLVFDIISGSKAKVTTYVNGKQDGEAKEVTITGGQLQLAFACKAYYENSSAKTRNEAYLDNVKVFGVSSK